jgi:hypothetical protein
MLSTGLLFANSASAQVTTWEEDIQKAKKLEAQHDFVGAERIYRHALTNFHDAVVPSTLPAATGTMFLSGGSGQVLFGKSRSSIPSCNCADGEKCAETLKALLMVLYAEKKFCSAVPVCKALVNYIEQHASGPHDPALVAAKANYKKLLERLTNTRWPTLAPLFQQYKFVGMQRTRVHEILGPASGAANNDSATPPQIEFGDIKILGLHSMSGSDFHVDGMSNPGRRDFYVISAMNGDPPGFGSTAIDEGSQVEGACCWLDIDYMNDRVVRYRLRSRNEAGKWVSDNRTSPAGPMNW